MSLPECAGDALLLCRLCDKPFVQETSYKRHVAYCRRNQNKPRLRTKACISCREAKLRCTSEPRCSRCLSKGLECVYERPRAVARPDVEETAMVPVSLPDSNKPMFFDAVPPLGPLTCWQDSLDMSFGAPFDFGTSSTAGGMTFASSAPPLSDHAIATEIPAAGNYCFPTVDLTSTQHMEFLWSSSSTTENSIIKHTIASRVEKLQRLRVPNPFADNPLKFPNGGLLTAKAFETPQASWAADQIKRAMASFPRMMVRKSLFPPFIHPHWNRPAEDSLPTALKNCMAVAQLFVSRTQDTKAFLWKMIDNEMDRVFEHGHKFTGADLLASMQAQIIYVIMRLVDGEQEPVGFNVRLLEVHAALCKHIVASGIFLFSLGESEGQKTRGCWEEWIYEESYRRTVVIFFLIGRIAKVKLTNSYCPIFYGWHIIQPCESRALWQARDRETWEAERAADLSTPSTSRFKSIGELIDAHHNSSNVHNAAVKLEQWHTEMDTLGQLVSMAAISLCDKPVRAPPTSPSGYCSRHLPDPFIPPPPTTA